MTKKLVNFNNIDFGDLRERIKNMTAEDLGLERAQATLSRKEHDFLLISGSMFPFNRIEAINWDHKWDPDKDKGSENYKAQKGEPSLFIYAGNWELTIPVRSLSYNDHSQLRYYFPEAYKLHIGGDDG